VQYVVRCLTSLPLHARWRHSAMFLQTSLLRKLYWNN